MDPSLTRARRGAALAIVAALLLANPVYVGLAVPAEPSRSPTGYVAVPVDPANESDQVTAIDAVGGDDVVFVDHLAEAADYRPHGAQYRAPGAAAEVLERAIADGTATTTDPDAAFTLRRVLATHRYVAVGERGDRSYYRASLDTRGDGATVNLTAVDRRTVVNHVLHRDARLYSGLPGPRKDTVDEVLASEHGYRPTDDGFDELTDDVLVKDGTYYVFRAGIHADDFGPSRRGLARFGLTALGLVALLASLALVGLSYLGGRRDEDDDVERRTDV